MVTLLWYLYDGFTVVICIYDRKIFVIVDYFLLGQPKRDLTEHTKKINNFLVLKYNRLGKVILSGLIC